MRPLNWNSKKAKFAEKEANKFFEMANIGSLSLTNQDLTIKH